MSLDLSPVFATAGEVKQGGALWQLLVRLYNLAGGGANAGLANTVYVSKAGLDATGERGNLAKPFLTINGAMAAAHASDTIAIGPGTYVENLDIVLTGLSFEGTGNVVIQGEAGTPVISSTGPATVLLVEFSNIQIDGATNATTAISFIGTALTPVTGATDFLSATALFDNCVVLGNVIATACGPVYFSGPYSAVSGNITVTQSAVHLDGTQLFGNLTVAYDSTTVTPRPLGGRPQTKVFNGANISGTLVLTGQPNVLVARGSTVTGVLTATGLTSTAAGTAPDSANMTPYVEHHGTQTGATSITFPDTAFASGTMTATVFNFDWCRFVGAFTLAQGAAGDASLLLYSQSVAGTTQAFAQGAIWEAAATFTGARVQFDARGSIFKLLSASATPSTAGTAPAGTGAVDRDDLGSVAKANGGAAGTLAVVFAAPLPAALGVQDYIVSIESSVLSTQATNTGFFVSGKTAAGYTANWPAAAAGFIFAHARRRSNGGAVT